MDTPASRRRGPARRGPGARPGGARTSAPLARSRRALRAALRASANRFDAGALDIKRTALARLAALPLGADAALAEYHDTLLFIAAHPPDAGALAAVEAELARIARRTKELKAQRGGHPAALAERGLPWVDTVSRFTHDCLRWLLAHPHCRVRAETSREPLFDFNAVLALTLPSLERSETTAGLGNEALLERLEVRPGRRLEFLARELGRLDALPFVKDRLFDALDLYVRVEPTSRAFSKAYNRLASKRPAFVQPGLLRSFDAIALVNAPLSAPRRLSAAARDEAIRVLKNTMTLTCRETDPATYLDPASLRVHDLDRGLACAIFGMTPPRQLPLESYVGFTLFKNGFAVAYGGAWILGARALFGMNIFEPFRGGESGYMMCQVLRTYRQSFGVRHFEVDAYQFGLDNPDGIASGAFWFYYRHGFRPLAASLRALAAREKRRIDTQPGHRSSDETLLRFTESNAALDFGGPLPPRVADVTARVTRMIAREYGGDRPLAEADCSARFVEAAALRTRLDADERRVLAEVALVWRALRITDAEGIAGLAQMVRTKPRDVFAYQKLLLAFFATPRLRRANA